MIYQAGATNRRQAQPHWPDNRSQGRSHSDQALTATGNITVVPSPTLVLVDANNTHKLQLELQAAL